MRDYTLAIGRDPHSDLVLADDSVSRQHASLTYRADGTLLLADLGSVNGTWVMRNGERERISRCEITVDDMVGIGDVEMPVQLLLQELLTRHPDCLGESSASARETRVIRRPLPSVPKAVVAVLLVTLALVAAWPRLTRPADSSKETLGQLYAAYSSRWAEVERRWEAVAAALPPAGRVSDPAQSGQLDPRPSLENTEIVALVDGRLEMPAGMASAAALMKEAPGWWAGRAYLKRTQAEAVARGVRYVVVLRGGDQVKPAVTGTSFTGGHRAVDVMVVDLDRGQVKTWFRVLGRSSREVRFTETLRNGVRVSDNRDQSARADLNHNTARAVLEGLRRATGGEFSASLTLPP